LEYQRFQLANGLTIVGERYAHARSVSLGLWVQLGSSDECPKESGTSHFIEHMVFKGTSRRSAFEIATALEARGGDLNAFTDREHTCFHATVLPEDLTLALDVISDLVIRPEFDRRDLERERKVLLQELVQIEDVPEDWIFDRFTSMVWKNDPLGQSVIGSRASIAGVTRAHLKKFFQEHYSADKMVLAVAGRFEFSELLALCENLFVFEDRQKSLPLKRMPSRYRPRRLSTAADTETTHVLVGFEGVGITDPTRFDVLSLSVYLGGGMSSRLFQRIREKEALAYSVESEMVPFSDAGLVTIYAGLSNRSLDRCMDIISEELVEICEKPIAAPDLDRVKRQLEGSVLLASEQMEIRQESLGRNELIFNRHVGVDEIISGIRGVTPEGVHRAAKKVFRSQPESVLVLGKRKKSVPALGLV
jgi:predicted Zn-dependent peptidase